MNRTRTRMNYGLRWQQDHLRASDLREWAHTGWAMVVILLAFVLVGAIDAATEARIEAARQTEVAEKQQAVLTEVAEKQQAVLLACMAGTARFITADGQYGVSCRPADDFKL